MRMRELIDNVRLIMADDDGDYLDDTKMLNFANKALREISEMCRAIHEAKAISINANQVNYGLPDEFLSMEMVMFNYPWGWKEVKAARLKKVETLAGAPFDAPYPYCYTIWQNAYVEKVVSADVAETFYTISEQTPNPSIGIPGGYVGVEPGDILINLSDLDASTNVISSVPYMINNEPQLLIYFPVIGLGGGGDERVRGYPNIGDTIRITSPHAYNKTLSIAPVPNTSDDLGVESLKIYETRKHRVITAQDMDDESDDLELDSELWTAAEWRTAYWGYAAVLGLDSRQFALAKNEFREAYYTALPNVNQRFENAINTWQDNLDAIYSTGAFADITGSPTTPFTNDFNDIFIA